MTSAEPIELTCPYCKRTFSSEALMSTNTFGGVHTDFRGEAVGYQPRQFMIHSCPNCGFSGTGEDFKRSPSRSLAKLIKERLRPLELDRFHRPTPAWRKFEYAAQISNWKRQPPEETANLFLLAAYTCADFGELEEETLNRKKAIEFFTVALQQGNIATNDLPELTYLVGELYRRIGHQTEAVKWLERAEGLAAADSDLEWLAKLAKQQRIDPQEYMNE